MRRLLLAAVILALALLGAAPPAAAGGWALASLDAPPQPVAGRPTEVGFWILQHGVTPARLDTDVGVEITTASGRTTFVAAAPSGAVGHYVATVQLDEPGTTRWAVHMGWFGAQDLGPIAVSPADAATSAVTAAGPDVAAAVPLHEPADTGRRWPSGVRYATAAGAVLLACASIGGLRRPRRTHAAVA